MKNSPKAKPIRLHMTCFTQFGKVSDNPTVDVVEDLKKMYEKDPNLSFTLGKCRKLSVDMETCTTAVEQMISECQNYKSKNSCWKVIDNIFYLYVKWLIEIIRILEKWRVILRDFVIIKFDVLQDQILYLIGIYIFVRSNSVTYIQGRLIIVSYSTHIFPNKHDKDLYLTHMYD